ncbi:MAG: hypothetical protein IJM63_00215 [Solobacterium sp.]|nr:hypothetical protein [Solobacterium sp.]
MKSQTIRQRNIPADISVSRRVQLKPTITLVLMLMLGMIFVAAKPYLFLSGIMMSMLGLFCLFVMPDGVLCEFTREYLILYNRKHSDCMLVYWEDIVSWHYEKHHNNDLLIVTLVDGSTEIQEVYSKRIQKYMRNYVPDKEDRSRTRRLL